MQVISLFSGIGGFEDAAQQLGWDNVVSCEINKFGKYVLEGHWPNQYHHDDIHTLNYETIKEKSNWDPTKPTIIVGGFPCQPYSTAGKRLGKNDERHLWPEMLRLISEIKPDFIVGENVRGLLSWSNGLVFEEVCTDLEAQGYEVWPYILPAAGVNAPHRRDRIWFIAHASGNGFKPRGLGENRLAQGEGIEQKSEWKRIRANIRRACQQRFIANTDKNRFQGSEFNGSIRSKGQVEREGRPIVGPVCNQWENFPTQSPVCNGNDGFPSESLRQRIREDCMGVISEEEINEILSRAYSKWRNETIKAGGNAIVPDVALNIFQAIQQLIDQSKI
jgi:DNA (cytosine-5)-methyltransferase 1